MKQNPYPGRFIVFEGLDGSGQTTQAQLLTKWFQEKRGQLAYYTKEPTDGPVGALLKLVLSRRLGCAKSNKEHDPLDEITMALFFAADRSDHLNNEIFPKLKQEIHVIGDRYYLSSLAYQSVLADYEWIEEINRHTIQPDLTFFLDVPPALCVKRMQAQRWHVEIYEDLSNLEKVQRNFHYAIERRRKEGERIEIVNGNEPLKDVHRAIVQRVKHFLKSKTTLPEHDQQLNLRLEETEALTEAEIANHQEG